MELSQLLSQVRYEVIQGTVHTRVAGVTNDTRDLKRGDVYVCIEGYDTDGHRFVPEAVKKGAPVIVTAKEITCPEGVTVIRVSDTRWALAAMSAAALGYPVEHLRVIGITGTKGKTTTAWMLRDILRRAEGACGLIGTVETDTGLRRFPSVHTTPESCQLMAYFQEMREAGLQSAVMEVSSQALKLERTACIPFHMGIFTNLGEDHIGPGEHADLQEYRWCKHLLFLQCETGLGNRDDPCWGEIFDRTGCRKITFGTGEGADYRAVEIRRETRGDCPGMCFAMEGREGTFFIPLPGRYNVYNALAAAAAAFELGVGEETVREALGRVSIPGRMERIPSGDGRCIFLDYAHNALSLANALGTLRGLAKGRLIVLFGCGGNRSRQRRFEMGETAGRMADETVITSDNPREEKPEDILADIVEGMRRTEGTYTVIPDRREAIRYALDCSGSGDVVLIAGKGHETYQEIQGVRYPMDDREIILGVLRGEKDR